MSYAKALAALKGYAPRRLAAATYMNDAGDCCAVGALARVAHVGIGRLSGGPADALRRYRIERHEIDALMECNDAPGDAGDHRFEAPEARYTRVVAWLRARVAEEAGR